MLKEFALAAALLMAGAVPAFAQDSIARRRPFRPRWMAPPPPRDQLLAAHRGRQRLILPPPTPIRLASAIISRRRKADAAKDKKPVDPALIQKEGDKVTANQASKQKVGDDINASIGAYKKAHPT